MKHILYINRFEKEFERAGGDSSLPGNIDALEVDTPEVESNFEALRGLITMIVEGSEIEDKERAVSMLVSDNLVQQRFLDNEFTDREGKAIDPTAFLLTRFEVLNNSVSHTVPRALRQDDMAQPSRSWLHDNLDGN